MYVLQTLGAVALHPGSTVDLSVEPLLRGSKTLVLAAYLAERPDHSATREHLAELFWPSVQSSQARRSLRQALYYLTQSGGEGILESEGEVVRLTPDCCTLDRQLFEQALREKRYEDAAKLYTGPFLQGYDPGRSEELAHWIESVRERIQVGFRQALRESARTALVGGDPEKAVAHARRAADSFPLDDPVHALLLEALTAAGRPGEAVREYEAYRVLLHEELEDVPSGDITEIAERARELAQERPDSEPAHPPHDRPAPEPDQPVSPVRMLSRALVLVAAIAAVTVLALRLGSRPVAGSGDRVGGPGSDPAAAPILVRANLRVPGAVQSVTLEFKGENPPEATIVPGSEGVKDQLTMQSPDGRYEARRVLTANGPDLEIADARTGETVARIPNPDGRTPDDHIHSWSPDSRQLLFSSGLFDANGEYDIRLYLFDLELETVRPLMDRRVGSGRNEAWSPRGDRIVFEGLREGTGPEDQRTDIFVASVDGSRTTSLTNDDVLETEISWSPDGTRLVYRKGTIEAGDIHVLNIESGSAIAVASTAWPERGPVWISNAYVAYVTDHPDGSDLWTVRADGSTPTRRITNGLEVVGLWQRLGPPGLEPWIETVRASVAAPGDVLSPGEHSQLHVEIRDARGTPVHPGSADLEWRVLEPHRAAILDNRLLAVRDTGTIRIVADVGGWRADTLLLESRPLETGTTELLFEERWEDGLSDSTWEAFGTPEPTVRVDGGPDGGGRFRNEGDANGESGALTNRRFPTADGITVEAWGRVPLTGAHFQTWSLDLSGQTLRDPGSGERNLHDRSGWIVLISEGGARPSTAYLQGPIEEVPVPEPDRIDDWRLHTLQVHPDGVVEWIIDGRRHASIQSDRPVPDSVHVAVGGRTIDTDVEHGIVRVWRGLRYLPEP